MEEQCVCVHRYVCVICKQHACFRVQRKVCVIGNRVAQCIGWMEFFLKYEILVIQVKQSNSSLYW